MYKNNHIIQKNNQKMEVAVSYWDRLFTIDYYDYINPIMRSKDYIDSEINIIYKFVTPDNKSIYKTYDPFKSVPEYQKYTKKSLTHDLLEYYINFLEYIMDITYFKIM